MPICLIKTTVQKIFISLENTKHSYCPLSAAIGYHEAYSIRPLVPRYIGHTSGVMFEFSL